MHACMIVDVNPRDGAADKRDAPAQIALTNAVAVDGIS